MLAFGRHGDQIGLREVAVPTPAAGEALVRVRVAGICNTDLEIIRGYMSFEGTLGHEFVGVVEECADASWLGARVAGEINLACRQCDLCQRGLERHCPKRTVLGILGKDGAFAEYLTLPIHNLHRVPAGLSDRAACFIEPLAACFEILEQVAISALDRVAVLGDGKLGTLAALVLQSHGASPVLVGKHPTKLARAQQLVPCISDYLHISARDRRRLARRATAGILSVFQGCATQRAASRPCRDMRIITDTGD